MGTLLLPAVEPPLMPYSTTSCRKSSPYAMLGSILPENTCCRRCSTASSGCHPGRNALAQVIKNRPRLCLTTFCRQAHNSLVLGDHVQLRHGSGWCLTTGGHRAPLEGVLDGIMA